VAQVHLFKMSLPAKIFLSFYNEDWEANAAQNIQNALGFSQPNQKKKK